MNCWPLSSEGDEKSILTIEIQLSFKMGFKSIHVLKLGMTPKNIVQK